MGSSRLLGREGIFDLASSEERDVGEVVDGIVVEIANLQPGAGCQLKFILTPEKRRRAAE